MREPPDPYVPPPPLCQVEVNAHASSTNVLISGEIDLSTAGMVEQRIAAALEHSPSSRLVVDLRELAFMDSTGLGLLVTLHRDAANKGYQLIVVRPPRDVYRPIEIAGLGEALDFVDDPVEATES